MQFNNPHQKFSNLTETFKMVEEQDGEITFLPTHTSEIHLHVEQPLQNTYRTVAEDLRPPKRQENPHVPG